MRPGGVTRRTAGCGSSRNGYQFPVTLDHGTLRKRFTAHRVIPMTYVLDHQGRLLQAIPGEMAEDDVLGLARVLQRPAR